jgi:hypothetical protein
MSSQAPSPELKLGSALRDTINHALEHGRMLSVAYVGLDGRPELSFRGSVQAYSDTQLAIWVRNPEGGIIKAVRGGNIHVSLLYGELGPQSKAFVSFRGRGHVENSAAVRKTVYSSAPELERNLDKEQKGVPLIIDLDSVDGFFQGNALKMRR